MKARFELDIAPSSISMNHTPSLAARDLPCYLQSWGRFQARAGYFTERSEYDSFLFLYTIGGSGLITYRGREYSLSPEQAAFIDCSEYHFYRTGPEGFWELEWLHINGTALRHYFELLNGDDLQLMAMAAAPFPAKRNAALRQAHYVRSPRRLRNAKGHRPQHERTAFFREHLQPTA